MPRPGGRYGQRSEARGSYDQLWPLSEGQRWLRPTQAKARRSEVTMPNSRRPEVTIHQQRRAKVTKANGGCGNMNIPPVLLPTASCVALLGVRKTTEKKQCKLFIQILHTLHSTLQALMIK